MGIRYLQTFQQKQVPGGYYEVEILKEICLYKRWDPHPTLVIDVISFMTVHSRDKLTMIFGGGRYSVISEMYHSIFRRLKAAGAELVFFLDGPHQAEKDTIWLERQNVKYQDGCAIMELMTARTPAKTLVQTAGNRIPTVHVFLTEFKIICQQYGKMYVSFLNECDLEIVEFAHQVKALAIIADDSDFLIFPGGFRYWSARNLDVQTLTTMEYDRRALRKLLMLTEDQMKIFATFAGNDIVTFEDVERFLRDFGKPHEKFENLAYFIRRAFKEPLNAHAVREMSLYIFRSSAPEKLQQVQDSLGSYEIASLRCQNQTDKLLEYTMENGYQFMYQILTGGAIDLLMYFGDLRTDLSLLDIASPFFEKICGVLLQHKNDRNLIQKVYKKSSHEESYGIVALNPIYPVEILPDLYELYRSSEKKCDQFLDLKVNLLTWMVGVDRSVIATIPPKYLISLLTIVYLHKKQQLTTQQADLVLIIVHESITGKIPKILPLPQFYDPELVKKSFLYVKMWYWVACGLLAIGLTKVPKNIYWDGVYFHRLALESPRTIAGRLEAIQHLRVYATQQTEQQQ